MRLVKRRNSTKRSIISSRNNKAAPRHRVEISAGGLVYKRTDKGLFFAMLKDSYGKWTFPKGHVEPGESFVKTAKREIFEEIGLKNLKTVGKLGVIDIWFRDRYVKKGEVIHKYIHFYLFEVHPEAKMVKLSSNTEGEKILAVKWVPIKEIASKSDYKDMKPIVMQALKRMNFDRSKRYV